MATGGSFPKGPGREADHSPPANAEVKKIWIYTSIRLQGVVLNSLSTEKISPYFTLPVALCSPVIPHGLSWD
jgi:hypothetical protein